ncbi:MAG: transcriptional regulator of arginine metabolism [Planctomycetota bacterium]|jgi:transcriptional regulator of arginine metabolism
MQLPRSNRHIHILSLVDRQPIHSQAELAGLLAAEGYAVNQATLSRDLRELKVVKSSEGYRRLDALAPDSSKNHDKLESALQQWLTSATRVQNQVVIRTPPGGAQALALAIDRAALPDIIGTIAGDDTILVIAPDDKAALAITQTFNSQHAGAATR